MRDFDNEPSIRGNNIKSSTSFVSLAIRLGIRSNTTEDLRTIRAFQDASTIEQTTLSAETVVPSFDELPPLEIAEPKDMLEFAAQLLPYNPPQIVSDRERVNGILAEAGISNGSFTAPASANLTVAGAIANNSIIEDMSDSQNYVNLGNGWNIPIPSYQGNYETNYAAQAARGNHYLQTQKLAIIPNHPSLDGSINFETNSIILTFSGKPDVRSPGFWNIGSYDQDLKLVPNSIQRYSIGSLGTDLQYIQGGQVYGPNVTKENGEFQVLLQNRDVPPPVNWTGNWLPVASLATITCKCLVRLPTK